MDRIVYLFVAVVVIATMLAMIAIWSRRPLPAKLVALGLAAMLMPTAYLALADLLGRPKPARMEWFRTAASDAQVIGSRIREGEAIYLWLQFDAADEPWSYRLPWDIELAKQLHGASQRASEGSGSVRMRWADRDGADAAEPTFYAEPQRQLPPKPSGDGTRQVGGALRP